MSLSASVLPRAYRAAEGGERACNSANGKIQIAITCCIVCFRSQHAQLWHANRDSHSHSSHSLVSQLTSNLNSLLLPWTALTTAFSLPQFHQRTVSFNGNGPERSLRHLRAMAAACRMDGHVVSSRQNLDGVHSSTLRARSSSLACSAIFRIIG